MKQTKFTTAILTLGFLAACSSTPNLEPERITSSPESNQVAEDQKLQTQAVCVRRCEYKITNIGVSNTPSSRMTKLNAAGDVYGVQTNRPVRYSNGMLSVLPVPADINGSQTQPGETASFFATSNEYGDYMIAKRIVNSNATTSRYHSWFHRNGSPENAFSYKGSFHGIAMSDAGHNLSDDPDLQIAALQAQVPHLIWNVNQNTDTPISGPLTLSAINNSGVAVGFSTNLNMSRPVSWSNGATVNLGSLDPSGDSLGRATDVNSSGRIVGWTSVAGRQKAFQYFNGAAGLKMYTIGDLSCVTSQATAINDAGLIGLNGSGCVGQTIAMLSKDGGTRDLNHLIPSNSGWQIRQVIDINNAGQILVTAINSPNQPYPNYLRLDPVNLKSGAAESFLDNDGLQTTNINPGNDDAYAMVVQSNDKIILAGSSQNGQDNPNDLDFALVRYNEDGSRDGSFGTGVGANAGVVTTRVSDVNDEITAVALQSDGRIVVGGRTGRLGVNAFEDFVLARYNTNGSLDASFGANGIVITNFDTFNGFNTRDRIYDIAIQSNGRIVAAGYSTVCNCTALARYNTNGTLDTSFSGDGKFSIMIGGNGDDARAVGIQSDGKIVTAGSMSIGGNSSEFSLVRLNPNGSLDSSFGTNGLVRSNLQPMGESVALALKIQSNGRLLVAGRAGNNAAVVRYDTNGTLDSSFDADGMLISSVAGRFTGIDTQIDGKIITASRSTTASDDRADVQRFHIDGSLDLGFGINGSSRIIWNGSDTIHALGVQSNNDIVVAGSSTVPLSANSARNRDFAIARLNR
jgi:uncharacterized delta-60 repeat protein